MLWVREQGGGSGGAGQLCPRAAVDGEAWAQAQLAAQAVRRAEAGHHGLQESDLQTSSLLPVRKDAPSDPMPLRLLCSSPVRSLGICRGCPGVQRPQGYRE